MLDERHGVLVGGTSLWIGDGLDPQVESAVGEFLAWLLESEQQARWHRETGYFPVCDGAVQRLREDGWFEQNPQFAITSSRSPRTRPQPTAHRWACSRLSRHQLNNAVEAELSGWDAGED